MTRKITMRVSLVLMSTVALVMLCVLIVQASTPSKPNVDDDAPMVGDRGAFDKRLAPLPSEGQLPISIVAAPGIQHEHVMATDGTSGAIIAWTDERPFPGGLLNSHIIYAQRIVSATDPTLWADNGIPVIDLATHPSVGAIWHHDPAIVSDGAGGAIVGWLYGPYAQRLDGDGNRLWANHGVTITEDAVYQLNYLVMASDDAGGAFFVWADSRGGQTRLYAQRVSADGDVLWPDDVPLFSTAIQQRVGFDPAIVADGSGGAIIAWKDSRDSVWADVYAQRVTSAGVKLWGIDGTPVITDTDTEFDRRDVTLVADGGGGAFVAWEDDRETKSILVPSFVRNIFAQHLDSNGSRTWDSKGLRLSDLELDPCNWGGGEPCGGGSVAGAEQPAITHDGSGGIYVVWRRWQNMGIIQNSIRAQRVAANGTILWSPPLTQGLYLSPGFAYPAQPASAPDGLGGAFVAWHCRNDLGLEDDICLQRINGAGDLLCGGGVNIANLGGADLYPAIVTGQVGQSIVAWNNEDNIYAQLVNNCDGQLQGKADVMIRDNEQDDGAVPSPQPWWDSPDIWVRHDNDYGEQHQNPEQGQENTVYVQARNIGNLPVANVEVHLYWSEPGLGMAWPNDWQEISPGETIVSLSPGESQRVAIPWSPPRSGHSCLLVRLLTGDDPIIAEGDAPGDNNIAQKNVDIVELVQGRLMSGADGTIVFGTESASFDVANLEEQPVAADVIVERADFAISGTLMLDLGPDLFERWMTATGGTLDVAEVVTGTTSVQVTSPVSATILGLPLEAQERTPLTMTITGPTTDQTWLYVNVWERVNEQTIGGNILRAPVVYNLAETSKTASAEIVKPGDTVTFSVTLLNGGNRDISNVTLTDTLSLSLTYQTGSLDYPVGEGEFYLDRILWSGPLSLSQPLTITYAVTVNALASDGQLITNTVTVNDSLNPPTERSAVVEVEIHTDWFVYLPLVIKSE